MATQMKNEGPAASCEDVLDAFRRWQQALLRLDEVEKLRVKAQNDLLAADGEMRAIARKGGA